MPRPSSTSSLVLTSTWLPERKRREGEQQGGVRNFLRLRLPRNLCLEESIPLLDLCSSGGDGKRRISRARGELEDTETHAALSARQEMDKEARNHYHTRGSSRGGGGGTASERDMLLQWGNRKRLRCVKVQRRDVEAAATAAAEKAAIGQRRAAAAAAAAAAQHHPTGHAHHRVLRQSNSWLSRDVVLGTCHRSEEQRPDLIWCWFGEKLNLNEGWTSNSKMWSVFFLKN